MIKTYAILAAVIAVVLGVYLALPQGHFVETEFPLGADNAVVAYDDVSDGGTSKIEFDLKDSSLGFACTLGEDESHGAWCGLLFDLSRGNEKKFRNWTFVDSVILDVDVHGTNEILLKVWTYDPDVTKMEDARSFRLLLKEVALSEGRQRLAIPMEQFYTPEFWYRDGNVDTTLTRRHQESVARIEIAPGWNQKRGEKFSLAIYELTAKGVSNFGFGVVLFVVLVLTIIAIGRRHSIEKKDEGK